MNGPETQNEAVYTGNSMRGTFVPGETLILAETAFDTLQTGDVVAIFERSPYYVHRIIEKNADCAVTMGDNNPRPDALRLTRDSQFRLVTEVRGLDGIVRQIPGGEAGIAQFRRQQRKRRFAARMIRPFKPLKFLRLPANRETRFRDGTVQWSFGSIPIAARSPAGKTVYLHWSKRLFFRIPAQKGTNEDSKKPSV